MNPSPAITLSEVSFRYDSEYRWVLDSLSATIEHGSVTALLGPNGVGKTTLLYLMLGVLQPQQGELFLNGDALKGFPRQEISRMMGLVPQLESIPFPYRVLEYTAMGRAPHLGLLGAPDRHDYELVREILAMLGIEALADRNVQALSGGEAQLIRIARALAQEPDILLLDEPTAHLDLANKEHMLQVLCQLAEQDMTVLFTTHDPDVAFSIATHAVLMRDGGALASGDVASVLTSENLTRAYQVPITVREIEGYKVILRNAEGCP
ncbi:MAG: ABC transporter ATP-binding protein [Anaerolineales bacterium]|jgi:iron complex transport system ATP-binding protein